MCLFRGFAAWVSYQSSPGLQLGCREATVNPTPCYQSHGSRNEADTHTQEKHMYSGTHRRKKKRAHTHIGAKQKGGSDKSWFDNSAEIDIFLYGHDYKL